MRIVPHADRLRSSVARQIRELALRQMGTAKHVIENLEARLREARRVGEPIKKYGAFTLEADVVQAADSKCGVSQPAVAVVPVADASDVLGQRSRSSGDN